MDLEKQMVLQGNRLIRVRQVKCLCPIRYGSDANELELDDVCTNKTNYAC